MERIVSTRSDSLKNSRRNRARSAPLPVNNRSKQANGSRLIEGVDMRSALGRRYRELLHEYLSKTGGKHEQLVRQLVTLTLQRERMDAAVVRGEVVDSLDLVRISNAIGRCMVRLGLITADDVGEDATESAIAALRGHANAEAS